MLNLWVWNASAQLPVSLSSRWWLIERTQCLAFCIWDEGENGHVRKGGWLSNLWPPLFTSAYTWIIGTFNNWKENSRSAFSEIFTWRSSQINSQGLELPKQLYLPLSLPLSLCLFGAGLIDSLSKQNGLPSVNVSERKQNQNARLLRRHRCTC